MAGIGDKFVDLIDLEKSKDPDGSMAEVIEMLWEKNPMLKDAYMVECNNGTTHRHSIRTGLPTVAWGKLYKGTPQSKSTKQQVDDTTGFVEGMSTIDSRVLKLAGSKKAAMRMSEANAFIEVIANTVQAGMLYSNDAATPEQFLGLAPRFNSLSGSKNSSQVIDGGGSGSVNTSVWFITWGDDTVHGLYPQGTKAGVEREDHGKQRVSDSNGDPYYVYEEQFTQHMGVAVADWRYVVRIANIDTAALAAGTVDLYTLFTKALYKHEGRRSGDRKANTFIYCNSAVMEALDLQATNKGASDNFIRLTPKEVQGEEISSWRGFGIRETDAILNTEEAVV